MTGGQDSAHSFADWCSSEVVPKCPKSKSAGLAKFRPGLLQVYHLIPTWDSTGFRGTDLAMGTDLQDGCVVVGSKIGPPELVPR